MKIKIKEYALRDNYKFEVDLELDENWINSETDKMVKNQLNMPDNEYVDYIIRNHSVGNIILTVWEIYEDSDIGLGQYFIAPKNWKEEIVARCMQRSTDLVNTIIAEMDVKIKKEIWNIVNSKKNKKEVVEENKESKMTIETEEHIASPIWEIKQNRDYKMLNIKIQCFSNPKNLKRELSAKEISSVEAFAKYFIERVNILVEWNAVGNMGKVSKSFDSYLGLDKILEEAKNISDIPLFSDTSNYDLFEKDFTDWLIVQRSNYVGMHQKPVSYKLEMEKVPNCFSFTIKKLPKNKDSVTVVLVPRKHSELGKESSFFYFKNLLTEVLIYSTMGGERETFRYTREDLKFCSSLPDFLKSAIAKLFKDVNSLAAYTIGLSENMNIWLEELAKAAKEKLTENEKTESAEEEESLTTSKEVYAFKANFIVENVRFNFETNVNLKNIRKAKNLVKALTGNAMHWHIKLLEPNRRTEFDFFETVELGCSEDLVDYIEEKLDTCRIEFDHRESYRVVATKLLNVFEKFISYKEAKVFSEKKTAEDLLKEEFKNTINKMRNCFYESIDFPFNKSTYKMEFESLYNKLLGVL